MGIDPRRHTGTNPHTASLLRVRMVILVGMLLVYLAAFSYMVFFSHIHVINLHDFAEVYLNVMLTIPLGYLLPYIFSWYRAKVRIRPVLTTFLLSLFTENVQLVTKVGF